MRTIYSSSLFANVDSFEELRSSSIDATFVAKTAIHSYSTHTSQAILTESLPGSDTPTRHCGCAFLNEVMNIPALLVHKLQHATIYPGKIRGRNGAWHSSGQLLVTSDNKLCEESYGIMDGGRTLPEDLIALDSATGQLHLTSLPPKVHLKGNYLFLGSMHDHFGHFLVEGLSRLWVLNHFTEDEISALKIIIYEPGLIPPATKILNYLGIDKSQIHFLNEPCTIESILVPANAYRTHFWARAEMNSVYQKIAASALVERQKDFPTKIFLSRSNTAARKLTNEAELEQVHREAGYWVFRPEDLPIGDQIRIAANAESIAGCTGSNMYLAMFQKPGGKNFIYAPYDFTLKDDAMISQLRGSTLKYVMGTPLARDQWTVDTYAVNKLLKD
ncbi:glycosyltransferase family 61 protein [Pseudomonas asiatica]|uniref:glycosyltransferase family 61 protein n=1 Tax=Pseudomonas asiatica TaxID=2219225 RepID=UPI0023673D15|nr:glycosyltransferase 61 family protein [Pseudomonas asiatica]MDD1984023.1 glycosyltransferase family 61 protein [Pseudomonas asiatica]WDM90750.1 glycosyltransferase family 61 protein [Pseudomonas asiatica]